MLSTREDNIFVPTFDRVLEREERAAVPVRKSRPCKQCGKMVKYMAKHLRSHAERKYCYPCKRNVKYWKSHIATKTHKQFEANPISLYCSLCNWTAPHIWEAHQHLTKYRHKRLERLKKIENLAELNIRVYKCPNFLTCRYSGYEYHPYKVHFKRCQKRIIAALPQIVIPSKEKKETKEKKLKKSISTVLKKLFEAKRNPNDYFNYGFYASSLKVLTVAELESFLEELLLIC